MSTEISIVVVTVVMGVLTLAAIYAGRGIRSLQAVIKDFIEQKYQELPIDLRARLDEAVALATQFVEFLDQEGRLSEFIQHEIVDKSKEKLYLAVDLAIERVEDFIYQELGVRVDIPEDQVIMLIETYILNNPDEFNHDEPG